MSPARALTLAVVLVALPVKARAASNTVPASRLSTIEAAITADTLKPTDCASITLAKVITGSGTFSGTSGNDLILGGPGNDSINGAGGNDCILGGGGADKLTGGAGTDACVGGAGKDTFKECETQLQ